MTFTSWLHEFGCVYANAFTSRSTEKNSIVATRVCVRCCGPFVIEAHSRKWLRKCVSLTNRICCASESSVTHTHTPSPHRDYWHIFLLAASPSPTTIDRAAERAQFSSFDEAKKGVERKLIEQITYAYWIAICDTSNSDRRIHFCWKVRAERFGWTLVQCVRDLLLIFLNRGKTSPKMKRLNGKIQNEKR